MKKITLLLAGFMLLSAVAWSDEIELGIGAAASPTVSVGGSNDALSVLRVAYTTLGIFQVSLDSLILPPSIIENMTSTYVYPTDGDPYTVRGVYFPGMVNLVDVGIKFALLNKLVLGVQVGVNSLYIYHLDQLKADGLVSDSQLNLGANIKISTGWKFTDALGLELALYSVQPDVNTAIQALQGLGSKSSAEQDAAINQLTQNAFLGALFVLYL